MPPATKSTCAGPLIMYLSPITCAQSAASPYLPDAPSVPPALPWPHSVALFGIDTVLSLVARPLPPPPPAQSLYAAIAADPQLSTLKSTIDTAGLAARLSNPALNYTLFAPNDNVCGPAS